MYSKKPVNFVVNTDNYGQPGEHWVAVYISNDGFGEYFDSLAQPPLEEFTRFMNSHCRRWIASEKQLQSAISKFCGHYCIFYCAFRAIGYNINRISNLFTSDTGLNDYMVHAFVCARLRKL